MLYHITTDERTAGDRRGPVFVLSRPDLGSSIEVWPAHGFNCLRWSVAGRELLYHSPEWRENPVPTRSGIPILFPFPNRIRDGVFTYRGTTYELPKNDSANANAIHGFAPRVGWQVVGSGATADEVWIQGKFELSRDVPESAGRWPGHGQLVLTYRLRADRLRLEFVVKNTGDTPFPFGLGLHPYLRPWDDPAVDRWVLHAPARSIWRLADTLPTGEKDSPPPDLDWNWPRPVGGTKLDTVYGDLDAIRTEPVGWRLRAVLGHQDQPGRLEVWTTDDFREEVLFTPPHRKAICVEPYTCVTDAIHLDQRGVDAGWRELSVGGQWAGSVEFRWGPAE